jgi:membrane protein implicated in regulation of membrane protease activity
MHKEMISVGLGILAAAIPLLVPNLSPLFGYALFSVAAILVLLGAWGFVRTTARSSAKDGGITILNVTIRK